MSSISTGRHPTRPSQSATLSHNHDSAARAEAEARAKVERDNAYVYHQLRELGLVKTPRPKKSKTVGFETPGKTGHGRPSSRKGSFLHRNGADPEKNNNSSSVRISPAPSKPNGDRSHDSKSGRSRSPPPRPYRNMAAVLDVEKSRTRRDRTFIGSECAVCEEPLEHTLRGERVYQLSCSHVAHEACFYEFIREFESQHCPTCDAPLGLDTTRGGNVLDLEKLSTIVRSVQLHELRDPQPAPLPASNAWDAQTTATQDNVRQDYQRKGSFRDSRMRESTQIAERYERMSTQPQSQQQPQQHHQQQNHHQQQHQQQHQQHQQHHHHHSQQHQSQQHHSRNDSGATGATGMASSVEYVDSQNPTGRRHDYDVQSMETSLSSPRAFKNPIPAPTVTVRSEFPTLCRSRQQQSLTCLVTVEVVEGKWRPDPEDMRVQLPSAQEDSFASQKSPPPHRRHESTYESPEVVDEITEDLHARVDNWHGLDFARFGKLRLNGTVRVSKDRQQWQELECYLFSEMLICVKEKKYPQQSQQWESVESLANGQKKSKCTLKGSILIKKHLKQVEQPQDESILTLSLSVTELPSFHLQFQNRTQLNLWKRALYDIKNPEPPTPIKIPADFDQDNSGTDEEDYKAAKSKRVSSSVNSSFGAARSTYTAPTEYSNSRTNANTNDPRLPYSFHVPIDIVVVIPVSSSMQGLKISLLRDTLRFLVQNLGERDRMGLVTFGSSGGGVPVVGMTTRAWNGWSKILDAIRPVGPKSLRADVVEGANVAMDLLMQRKSSNPLSNILLISDSSTSDGDSVDFVVSRAEAAKVAIHSFGLGLTHKPDTMIELSTRTKASYTYVKDWMMLRECVAGCLGSLQTTSHQNVKLKLRLPEGSPAKFVKISGALQITKRATGRDAEAALGDLRFGDKRDVLVQLAIAPENASPEQVPQDPWETIVSGLEALGGPIDQDDQRTLSVEEVPLIQADLTYGDILREGTLSHLPRPSLLAITMLPASSKTKSMTRPLTPPIPPHPSVVQRRMELLTSDMLTRALTLVSRGQHERANHLLTETRSILKGLGKGGLPPVPPLPGHRPTTSSGTNNTANTTTNNPSTTTNGSNPTPTSTPAPTGQSSPPRITTPERRRTPSPPNRGDSPFQPASGIDPTTMSALDAELEASLEWMNHPAVFGRDSRKAVLQAIGVISSQRGYSFRTPSESLWAGRIAGVKRLSERSREWREAGDEALMEET